MAQMLKAVEKVVGELQLAGTVSVAPTLVIGLGGSGTWTVRRLKRLMRLRYGEVPLVAFLCIDCDQRAFQSAPQLGDLTEAERVVLSISNPERILEDAQKGVGEWAKMQDWLPEQLNVAILRQTIGAGGIRPVGRFALFASLQGVVQKLESALNNVMAIQAQLDAVLREQAINVKVDSTQPRIYIVGSLCGGTGSSIFLDIAVLVRNRLLAIAPNATPGIVGIFYLPSAFENEQAIRANAAFRALLHANAYAALKEVEFFCDPNALHEKPFTFRYPNMADITVNAPVYDELFVLERGTPDGRLLNTSEEVLELAARCLLSDIGSPVGAHIRSVRANYETVLQMGPCPITQKLRLLHSMGITAVAVPIGELLSHAVTFHLRSMLEDFVLGQTYSADELRNEVDSFLKANNLEERGDRDDLIEALRQGVAYTLPRTREELEQEAGGNEVHQAQYVANWIEGEMHRLRTDVIPNARNHIEGAKASVLNNALNALDSRLFDIARSKGLRAAQQFLSEAIAAFEAMRDELSSEQEKSSDERNGLENTISNQVAFLRSLEGVLGWLRAMGRADEVAMDEALRALQRYGALLIKDIARQAALEVIASNQPVDGQPSLLTRLKQWQKDLETAIAKVNEVTKRCGEVLSTRYQTTPTGSTYTLEQWLIPPSEFNNIVEKIAFDRNAHRETLWQVLGSDFSAWLSSLVNKKSDELLEAFAEAIATELKKALRNSLSVHAILQQGDEKTKAIVQQMLRTCQPFWRAPQAPGGIAYEVTTVVGVPDEAVGNFLDKWLEEAGFTAEKEATGYPFVVEFLKRVYGARAFYFASIHQMRGVYEQKSAFPSTRGLLHIDRRFLDLPDPVPPEYAQ